MPFHVLPCMHTYMCSSQYTRTHVSWACQPWNTYESQPSRLRRVWFDDGVFDPPLGSLESWDKCTQWSRVVSNGNMFYVHAMSPIKNRRFHLLIKRSHSVRWFCLFRCLFLGDFPAGHGLPETTRVLDPDLARCEFRGAETRHRREGTGRSRQGTREVGAVAGRGQGGCILVESLGRGRWPGVFALFFLGRFGGTSWLAVRSIVTHRAGQHLHKGFMANGVHTTIAS